VVDSVWSCKEEFGSACKGLPTDDKRAGKLYCVLHSPRVNKDLAAFEGAIEKKLKDKDFDFRGVYFPSNQRFQSYESLPHAIFKEEVRFSSATFTGRADFSGVAFEKGAHFDNATFEGWANFTSAIFNGAVFTMAVFKEAAYFIGTTFEDVRLSEATFEGWADFTSATFKGWANFSSVTFEKEARFTTAICEGWLDFAEATFKEGATFVSLQISSSQTQSPFGTTGGLRFPQAVIEKPERFSFHSMYLRPSWFIDVDAQKFDFSDVEWFELPNGDELKLEGEIAALVFEGQRSAPTLRRLQKACRQLTKNAEENRDYPTANEFHYWSMVLARKEAMVLVREQGLREGLREGLRRFGLIEALYGALSGYGERPRRAFLVLVGMWAGFAILYLVTGSVEYVGQAFLYSLAAMVRLTGVPAMAPLTELLQPSEPGLFQLLVTAEGILGPLQIALLALAIRRKVMR
jgi:uncharacterized protein YjbI with pentapeptide repeats